MKDLIAFYQTREQATGVKEQLVAAGFDRDDVTVYDAEGRNEGSFWSDLKNMLGFADSDEQQVYTEAIRRGGVAVGLSFDHDEGEPSSETAVRILQASNPIDVESQSKSWQASETGPTGARTSTGLHAAASIPASGTASTETGPTGARTGTSTAASAAATTLRGDNAEAIPVVQEELKVGKRAVQSGGVRIHSRVTETPVQEQVQLRKESVQVERRPVDRPVTTADEVFKDRTIEATAMSEEAVVSKQARVVEEVMIRKDVAQQTETVNDTVRRTDVDVENIDVDPKYAPVREFSTTFFNDQRFKGRDWKDVEPDVKQSFEKSYPGQWSEFREAIRTRYNRGNAATTKNV